MNSRYVGHLLFAILLSLVWSLASCDSNNRYLENSPPQDVINTRLSGVDRFSVTLDAIDRGRITESYPRLDILTALTNGFGQIRYRGRLYQHVPGVYGVLSLPDDGLADRYLVTEVHEELDDEKWSRATRIVVTDRETGEVIATRTWWKRVGSTWHPRNSPLKHWQFLLSVFNPPPKRGHDHQLVPVTFLEKTPDDFEYRDFAETSRIQGCGDDVQLHSTEFQERWIETASWQYGHWRSTYRIDQVFCRDKDIFLILGTIGAESLHIEWLNNTGEMRGHFFITFPDLGLGRRKNNWVDSIGVTDEKISIDKRLVRHVMESLPPEEMIASVIIEIDISQIDGTIPVRNENYRGGAELRPPFSQ